MSLETLFIGYSHTDEQWKDRLLKHLKVLVPEHSLGIVTWDESRTLDRVDPWESSVGARIHWAQVTVLLLSSDFLSSRKIMRAMPPLLTRQRAYGLLLVPVIVQPCPWKWVPWLAGARIRPRNGRPLALMKYLNAEKALHTIAREIADLNAGPNAEISGVIHGDQQPIQIHPLFISYSSPDAPFVEALEPRLDKLGVRYWRDVHDLKAGRLETQIDRAIRLNPTVLLVLSEKSVESDWVEWEVGQARKLEKELKRDVLCPVALDDAWKTCSWPGPLRRQIEDYHILDFSAWEDGGSFERQFGKLLEGLKLFYRPKE